MILFSFLAGKKICNIIVSNFPKWSCLNLIFEQLSDRVVFDQDMSPGARHFHLTMLPKNMQEFLVRIWNQDGKWRDVEDVLRSAAYHRDVDVLITKCLRYVVSKPAVLQAAKGIVTAGLSKTAVYSSKKLSKMLKS